MSAVISTKTVFLVLFFLLAIPSATYAQPPAPTATTPANPDETALSQSQWTKLVQSDFAQEKFADLDRMADRYRREKLRVQGGGWRLWFFYSALLSPYESKKQVQDYIAHAKHWEQKNPRSITARVALAMGYRKWSNPRYRSSGMVSPQDNADEYRERLQKARDILNDSVNMTPMCPQLYSVLMSLYSDSSHIKDAFQHGIQLAPDYFYLYRQYAWDLWHSNQPGDTILNYAGDDSVGPAGPTPLAGVSLAEPQVLMAGSGHPELAASFAQSVADQLGGDKGNLVYFEIAERLMTPESKFPVKDLNWKRIKNGYKILAAQYGVTQRQQNELALMAYKFGDKAVTREQLTSISSHWSRDVWGDQKYVDQVRKWCGLQPS